MGHPLSDPGDGRQECDVCGKWVWLVTHSCNRVPFTEAAIQRWTTRGKSIPEDDSIPVFLDQGVVLPASLVKLLGEELLDLINKPLPPKEESP